MIRTSMVLLSLLLASATLHAQGKAAAEKEARVLKGDDKGAAANNPQCKLFSFAEASRYIGASVKSVENAAMGFGCQWLVGGGDGAMIVSVVPARYHEVPKLAKGFKNLPDVGVRAFVALELGGWAAGSIVGAKAIRVSVDGKGASESTAVELLKEAMKRHAATVPK
ncbi:MAG: hypothetical protein JWP63_2191 [Candidatus Solibacter sp.]|nr:hypothetical protein [Candidatus Solibacter sp.]